MTSEIFDRGFSLTIFSMHFSTKIFSFSRGLSSISFNDNYLPFLLNKFPTSLLKETGTSQLSKFLVK